MIIITGACGFIGSNFVKYLNNKGITDIVVCDYLTNGKQFKNLNGTNYTTFVTPQRLMRLVENSTNLEKVFHFGAISDTTCWDGEVILERNTNFTIDLLQLCHSLEIPVSYSSSASVYGNGNGPLNLYAYSKWLVDKHVERLNSKFIQGFRYFNVWADDDSEWHKGNQASPQYQFKHQALNTGMIKIFEGSANFKRDFVHIDTICRMHWEFKVPGIFDLGSGEQKSFETVAEEIRAQHMCNIVEIPFPEHLKEHYQYSTLANMSYLENYTYITSKGMYK